MTDAMAAAIVGGLIGASAVIAGSWIAAYFTYKYARSKDREDRVERRKVLAGVMLRELLYIEVYTRTAMEMAVEYRFRQDDPATPVMARVADLAELFTPALVSAVTSLQATLQLFSNSLKDSAAAVAVDYPALGDSATAKDSLSPADRDRLDHLAALARAIGRRLNAASHAVYAQLVSAGGETPTSDGLSTEDTELGPFLTHRKIAPETLTATGNKAVAKSRAEIDADRQKLGMAKQPAPPV